jgi:hypothetical protein
MAFQFFRYVSKLYIEFNKTALLRGNKQELREICGETVGIRPRGFLVSHWLETQREMYPSGHHFCFGISQTVSATL